jgi:hypothetical protein
MEALFRTAFFRAAPPSLNPKHFPSAPPFSEKTAAIRKYPRSASACKNAFPAKPPPPATHQMDDRFRRQLSNTLFSPPSFPDEHPGHQSFLFYPAYKKRPAGGRAVSVLQRLISVQEHPSAFPKRRIRLFQSFRHRMLRPPLNQPAYGRCFQCRIPLPRLPGGFYRK